MCGPRSLAGIASRLRARAPPLYCRGRRGERPRDSRDGPLEHLLERRNRHRGEREVGPRSDIEPPCSRLQLVGVVDQPRKVFGARPDDPVVLDRLALAMARVHVQVGEAERPEQPLVADRDEEVRPKPPDIERHRAGGLRDVEHQRRFELVSSLAHRFEIDERAARPVNVRHRDDSRARVERAEDRLGPRLAILGAHRVDLRARAPRERPPRVDPRRILLGEHEYPLARTGVEVRRGDRHPVTRRWDQRHSLGVGTDQACEQFAEPLHLGEPVRGVDRPRSGPAVECRLTRGSDRAQLRCEVGDVEVRDPVRDLELRALLGGVELGSYGPRR
jgi:hypothetical protein